MDLHLLNTLLPTFTLYPPSKRCSRLAGLITTDIDLALPPVLMEMQEGINCISQLRVLLEDIIKNVEQELINFNSISNEENLFISALITYLQLVVTLVNFYSETTWDTWVINKQLVHKLFSLNKAN